MRRGQANVTCESARPARRSSRVQLRVVDESAEEPGEEGYRGQSNVHLTARDEELVEHFAVIAAAYVSWGVRPLVAWQRANAWLDEHPDGELPDGVEQQGQTSGRAGAARSAPFSALAAPETDRSPSPAEKGTTMPTTRDTILEALKEKPQTTGELVAAFGSHASNLVLKLKREGIIVCEKRGRPWSLANGAPAKTIADVAKKHAAQARKPRASARKSPPPAAPRGDTLIEALEAERDRLRARLSKVESLIEELA